MSLGVKETCDVISAANELAIIIIQHVKANPTPAGIPALVIDLVSNEQFKKSLTEAIENISQVPAEIADISLTDTFQIMQTQLSYVPMVLSALAK